MALAPNVATPRLQTPKDGSGLVLSAAYCPSTHLIAANSVATPDFAIAPLSLDASLERERRANVAAATPNPHGPQRDGPKQRRAELNISR